jgi:hypothetical protein
LTPVVENRARFTSFGGGVFPISPPGRRAAAAAREVVPPSSRAPPGEAERVEDSLNLGDDLLGTRPDRPMARALGEDMVDDGDGSGGVLVLSIFCHRKSILAMKYRQIR